MMLNQISYLDCLAFLVFLAPQLLIHVGLYEVLKCVLRALPFFVIKLPFRFVRERYFTRYEDKTPFCQHASPFQDFVIRCVRYAFAYIPASIGKVFFSRPVALPFLYWRMLRHGVSRSPIPWQEIDRPGLQGIWICCDESQLPDVVVYYCHGGGFSMGSSYFYLEFLLAWVSLLKDAGFKNPALFALEYTLVPEATYPRQIDETISGYDFVLAQAGGSPEKICLGGDSAGATLQLSLLLHLSKESTPKYPLPAFAIIISPWAVIISPKNQDTPSDYLNAESLHLYGSQYIGTKASADDPVVSPGSCRDISWWQRATPSRGFFFIYGAEEVFAPETEDLVGFLKKTGAQVGVHSEKGWIHAWPVVKLFLCDGQDARQSGLKTMTAAIRHKIKSI
ncbi:hypothetical protein AAFC00_005792 [Neodothiora populina]|uniref:Alpha/beta hydrolase fold-3 domain-containing protein n=1 Tax=Neodothiora populina TaxID=2781224 RepID=A0ABR3P611_9PEZI